jgi:hypothetical protein
MAARVVDAPVSITRKRLVWGLVVSPSHVRRCIRVTMSGDC